jgi:hypothetical protein
MHTQVCCRFVRGRHPYIISKRVHLTLFPLAHAVRSSPSGKLEGALALERGAEYMSGFLSTRRRLRHRGLCIHTRVWYLRLAMRQRFRSFPWTTWKRSSAQTACITTCSRNPHVKNVHSKCESITVHTYMRSVPFSEAALTVERSSECLMRMYFECESYPQLVENCLSRSPKAIVGTSRKVLHHHILEVPLEAHITQLL